MESYFDHYVLGGGWAMALLLPAGLIALSAFVRAWLAIAHAGAADAADEGSPARRISDRLRTLHARHATLTADDVRAEAASEALHLVATLQPLAAAAALAPLAGALGTLTALMQAHADASRSGAAAGTVDWLPSAVERAMVPSLWGMAIALAATAGHALLRARVWRVESRVLIPVAERVADALLHGSRRQAAGVRSARLGGRPKRLDVAPTADGDGEAEAER